MPLSKVGVGRSAASRKRRLRNRDGAGGGRASAPFRSPTTAARLRGPCRRGGCRQSRLVFGASYGEEALLCGRKLLLGPARRPGATAPARPRRVDLAGQGLGAGTAPARAAP